MVGNHETGNLGARVKEIRKARRMSMRQLAARAGVASSYVSDLEADRLSPTLATLRKILTALNTSLADLLASDGGLLNGYTFRSSDMRSAIDEMHRNRFVLPRRLDIHMEMLDETILPGPQPEFETLTSDEAGYVIEGELCLQVEGDEPVLLKPGDSFYVSAGKPLRGYCAGNEPVRLIAAYHPPRY